ncbi:MAG: hypothetical protein ACREXJ_15835, partial [Gammaproteobacteria bacterium]
MDYPADVPALRRKGAQAMNVAGRAFDLVDAQKLLSGEADYSAGRVIAPDLGARPFGLIYDVRLGKHSVRFLFAQGPDGIPLTAGIWKPAPPKRLKPSLLKKYRRERRAFAVEVAKTFGWCLPIIDRFGGDPRISEIVLPTGEVERMDPPIAYREA